MLRVVIIVGGGEEEVAPREELLVAAALLRLLLLLLLLLLPPPPPPPVPLLPRPRLPSSSSSPSKTPLATARHQPPLRFRATADAGKTHPRMKAAVISSGNWELGSPAGLGAKRAAASADRSGGKE